MEAGRPRKPPRRDYRRVEQAVDAAENETGLQFCVYLGPAGEEGSRAEAERLFVEAGLDARPAVLVLVDPEHHKVEVVTAPETRTRVSDEAATEAVLTMTPRFAQGDIPGGIVAGIRRLAAAAGPGQAPPGAQELPDVLGGPADSGEREKPPGFIGRRLISSLGRRGGTSSIGLVLGTFRTFRPTPTRRLNRPRQRVDVIGMRRLARLLLVCGTGAAVVGLSKAHAVRMGYDYSQSARFTWSLAYVVLLAAAAYGAGLPDLVRGRRASFTAAVGSTAAAALGISFIQLVTGSLLLPRFVVFGAALVLVPFYVLCASLSADGRARDGGRDRVLVVGGLGEEMQLRDELEEHPERPAVVAAVLTPQAASSSDPVRRPLIDAAADAQVTAIVLDRAAQADETIVAQAAELHEAGIRVRTLSLFYEQWLGKLPVTELERVSLMFDIGELHRARYGRIKRILDAAAGTAGLLALALVTPVVVLGNRFANRGPLFYRQARVGKGGRLFQIHKFRTMAPGGQNTAWTADDDPRITPFGAWLRKTHLDELPQALNMLRGDLSIVGPRPEQPQYVSELSEKIPFYNLRHLVRPGLTGWAQVKYPYGASELDALQKLQYEFYYLRHQSLRLDARIIGRTLRSVLGRGGR